jgi:hypothetical protein
MMILRVKMNALETSFEDLPELWKLLVGRGLNLFLKHLLRSKATQSKNLRMRIA